MFSLLEIHRKTYYMIQINIIWLIFIYNNYTQLNITIEKPKNERAVTEKSYIHFETKIGYL